MSSRIRWVRRLVATAAAAGAAVALTAGPALADGWQSYSVSGSEGKVWGAAYDSVGSQTWKVRFTLQDFAGGNCSYVRLVDYFGYTQYRSDTVCGRTLGPVESPTLRLRGAKTYWVYLCINRDRGFPDTCTKKSLSTS